MNSSRNNENNWNRISTGTEESEKYADKLVEKRAFRKLAKRTKEIVEIEPALLTCLSSELVSKFDKFINKIFEVKCTEGSLVCYQIALNSLMELHANQYPSYSERALQEMTNSLLYKIFQKMGASDCAINCDENDLTKKRCHSELLCLLEMYLLRYSSLAFAPTNNKITDHGKNLAINSASTSASSSSIGVINFITEPKRQFQQKKNNGRPLSGPYELVTPTQLATKNIVARLRHLYLLCTDPEQFHQFIEDVLCDEFIEELPFYLVSIYEQLGIEIPAELQPFQPQESNHKKTGRPLRLDLGEYKNKCTDKLEQFLTKIEKFNDGSDNEDEEKGNEIIVRGKENGKKSKQIEISMKKQLTMAPKKPQIQSKALMMGRRFGNGKNRLEGATRFRGSAPKKIIDPPAGIAALRQKMKIGKQLAKRRILPYVPETPEKKIGLKKEEAKNGNKEQMREDEIVEQTPLGKIRTDNSSLAIKLAELLIREEMSQMSQLRQEIMEKNMDEFTSFAIDYAKENENRKISSASLKSNKTDRMKQCAENSSIRNISRKRPLTPSENLDTSSSVVDLLQISQQVAKRPCRRLFTSSRCSIISSTGTAFPFNGRQS